MRQSRDIVTYYTDADGDERDITVTVTQDGLYETLIESDLPEMSREEEASLRERVGDLYWQSEREQYLLSQSAQEPW